MTGKIRLILILLIIILPAKLLAQAPVIAYSSPQIYTINTAITPLAPTNTGGAVPVNAPYGQVTTFAGSGVVGNTNATGTSASFNFPTNVALDANKNLYVVDASNHLIRNVTPAGLVSTFAGSGTSAYADGTGTTASFFSPYGMAFDHSGNLYVNDYSEIRKITPAGVVTTIAGNSTPGYVNASGTAARFNSLGGICIDAAENIYVVDETNNVIRKVTTAGAVTTYAGTGVAGHDNGPITGATFSSLNNIAIDAAGNFYITEAGNNKIRKISTGGIVSDYAGTGAVGHDDGPVASASFYNPEGISTDNIGNVYVTEDLNNIIRKITPDGQVITLAGNYNMRGDADAIGDAASFSRPAGVTVDNGQLYLADALNNKIRLISLYGYTISKPLPAGLSFSGETGIISGTPTAAGAADNYVITAYNSAGSSSATVNLQVLSAGALPKPVITFTIPPNTHADADGNITPNGTSTSTESRIYYTSSDPSVATITADGLIHLVGLGIVTITAHQDASPDYDRADDVPVQIDYRRAQILTFPPFGTKTICNNLPFPANASTSSDSGIPITYSGNNNLVATVTPQGLIQIVGAGSVTITASQAAGPHYDAAIPQTQILTVSPPVNPTISINAGTYIPCDGATITFTAAITNAGSNPSYQWQINGAPVLNNNSNTLSSSAFHNNDIISCKVTNTTDCSTAPEASDSKPVILNTNVPPTVSIAPTAGGPYCSGSSITFTATSNISPANAGYQWLVNGIRSGTNSPSFTTTALNDGDVVTCQLTPHANACVTAPAVTSEGVTVSVTPNQLPSITVDASANHIYADTPVTFTATVTNITADIIYQWQVNGVNAGTSSPVFTTDRLKNNDIVTCTVTSVTGCVAPTTSLPITMVVLPPPKINIHNTFTPNGDGINDVWNIPDLSLYPNCLVSVFDRSGSLVYQSKGYSKPWDGTRNGRQLSAGTYYYVIKLSNNRESLAGSVTIIR